MPEKVDGSRLRIAIGAMTPPLREQVTKQGFRVQAKHAKLWDKAVFSMVFLRVRGVLTDAEAARVSKRIHKKFIEGVE